MLAIAVERIANGDLFDDLHASVPIDERFAEEISVSYHINDPSKECSLVKEMRIEEGTTEDWRKLADFHYRSHKIAAPRKIFRLRRGRRTLRRNCLLLPASCMFRTQTGIAKLIRDTLPLVGTEHVEMLRVMAKYNPFAEKAGMQKIMEQPPQEDALRIPMTLENLGFNNQLLGSENHSLKKLHSVKLDDVEIVREAFSKYNHPSS